MGASAAAMLWLTAIAVAADRAPAATKGVAATDAQAASAPPPGQFGSPPVGSQPTAPTAAPPSVATAPATIPEPEAATALDRARAAYEYGDMEMVVESARLVAEGRLRPTPFQRVQALRFLGIGLFLTGRPEGAETAFFDLLRQKPSAKLDPTHARPDVVAFFETVRARHSQEIRQAARDRSSKRLLLAFLPPFGQFQNGDRGRGFTLAALELVSAGVAIGTYAQLKTWVHDADKTFPPDKTDDARTLKVLNYVSISVLVATIGVGIIDGAANFNRADDELPLAWLTPNGLAFRF